MIPEIGHYTLILALVLAVMQVLLGWLGVLKQSIPCIQAVKHAAIAQCLCVAVSFFALAYAFIVNDFSVAYVTLHSHTHLPWMYRFCAIWGAHEGSLLLWVFLLTLWMLSVSLFRQRLPIDMLGRMLVILAMVAIGFYLLLLTASDPFLRIFDRVVSEGQDLNPLLQDPGLVLHPPVLYMGYVGFSVVFAFALAALWKGVFDKMWVRWVRPWTLMAWSFLTLGIVLGSWWAYRDLGWGGYWFWDPVENASFLPWLAGTALIHSLIATEKRDVFKAWTVFLAIGTFALSLLGTFLVRSGILISVHAFAVDPKRGLFILRFLAIVIGGSLLGYALRGRMMKSNTTFYFWSRETFILMNNMILFVIMLSILLGTLYPLLVDVFGIGKISVGAPYFNFIFIPLVVPLLFFMGMSSFTQWGRGAAGIHPSVWKQWIVACVASLIIALVLPWLFNASWKPTAWLGLALAFWLLWHTVSGCQWRWSPAWLAMKLAHLGMVVTCVGIVMNAAYSQERDLSVKIAEPITVASYTFRLLNVSDLKGVNYSGARASVSVSQGKRRVTLLHPELRLFDSSKIVIPKVAIYKTLFSDAYIALGRSLGEAHWEMRIYYKPFVRWIWMGGLLMMVGGLVAVIQACRRRLPPISFRHER